ncbi:hypothetical protein MMC25_002958 [Agyrium rufum]|nr:hypothetical protein [Agyrium rufum]
MSVSYETQCANDGHHDEVDNDDDDDDDDEDAPLPRTWDAVADNIFGTYYPHVQNMHTSMTIDKEAKRMRRRDAAREEERRQQLKSLEKERRVQEKAWHWNKRTNGEKWEIYVHVFRQNREFLRKRPQHFRHTIQTICLKDMMEGPSTGTGDGDNGNSSSSSNTREPLFALPYRIFTGEHCKRIYFAPNLSSEGPSRIPILDSGLSRTITQFGPHCFRLQSRHSDREYRVHVAKWCNGPTLTASEIGMERQIENACAFDVNQSSFAYFEGSSVVADEDAID